MSTKLLNSTLLLLVFLTSLQYSYAAAKTKLPEYTSRRDVFADEALRRDFSIQGEYVAKIGDGKMGLQLIADGGGKFRVSGYPEGLPGDGWTAGMPRVLGTAELSGDDITFTMTEGRGKDKDGNDVKLPEQIVTSGKVQIQRPQRPAETPNEPQQGPRERRFPGMQVSIDIPEKEGGMPRMLFEKTYRRSPTLGEKAPEGATVLFDGTNLDHFRDGANMNETRAGKTLWAEATAKPLENKPYKLHLEFMLSYMPQAQGQARSNSGVYINESYECQVLDSFGLEGENNECGGFYQTSKPAVNMCFPPLVWQTYDIEYTPPKFDGETKTENARVSVKHNGVVIQDNVEFPSESAGGKKESPEPRGFYLQGHGNKVQYRNIWVQYK